MGICAGGLLVRGDKVLLARRSGPSIPAEHGEARYHIFLVTAWGGGKPCLSNLPHSDAGRPRSRCHSVRPFCREPCRQPVELPADVVVHLREPEAFEPPRGSWAQVSGRIPAVDEYGPERIELFLGLGLEVSERETDGSRKMVGLELLPGQHLHHSHAFPHESPDVRAIDFLRHRYPRLAPSNRFKFTTNSSLVDYQS